MSKKSFEEFAKENIQSLIAACKKFDKANMPTKDFLAAVKNLGYDLDEKELQTLTIKYKIPSKQETVASQSIINEIKEAREADILLAELLNLVNLKVTKENLNAYRSALASLQPKELAQSILKRTGGNMSPEIFSKAYPYAAKAARSAETLLKASKLEPKSDCKGNMPAICPSVLSSDFAKLGEESKRMLKLGADWLHLDVMDGHFVPNLTIGAPVVKSLRKHTKAMLDCHLMVSNPEQWIPDFAKAGADTFCFHLEAVPDPKATIEKVKKAGISRVGIALKPDTPVSKVFPFAKDLHHVLIMTVEPGFGGQSFMWWTMPKVAALRLKFPDIHIQVDGGVKIHTIDACSKAGANLIVSGSGIFKAKDPAEVMRIMRTSVASQGCSA